MIRFLNILTNLFPVWVLLTGFIALYQPSYFTWFRGPLIVWGLAVIMLGMGLTLTIDDFRKVLKMPKAVAIGFSAQFCIMPFLGWSIAHILNLPDEFTIGLILVACCPGGTASNVVTYLAKANVALSVLMTMVSTFGAIVMTPLLTKALVGTLIHVNAWGLFLSTIQVVLLPIILGLVLRQFFQKQVLKILPISPLISVLAIVLICASIIGQNSVAILESGKILLLAVVLLHTGGFSLGYLLARTLGYEQLIRRTVAIEVGMQNSGLGVVLAQKHFSGTLATVPCAISAVVHSIIGSILAGLWRMKSPVENSEKKRLFEKGVNEV
ncbi:MAG: bile acid:sodium symporter family protein [Opitutaceae bacterium]|nr:bile acid:sodium symporter family protein [Opitutaceae bacterium]